MRKKLVTFRRLRGRGGLGGGGVVLEYSKNGT